MAESSTITREGDQPCISSRDQFPERRGDWMQTASGRRFWPLDPRPEDVCVEDIAHALSLQCRFGGHCLRFYSVAEHSVHLARWALSHGAGSFAERLTLALWLLLHDCGEAYVSDMVRPLKRHMPEFRQIEDGVTWAIYERFGLDPAIEPREVKQLDNRILMDERAQVMRPTGDAWHFGGETEPLGITLQFWSPEQAEAEFLATIWLLTPEGAAAEPHRCFACSEPFMDGDRVFEDVNEGTIHADCLGPERESYVGADGEPLKPGEPIPEPGIYRAAPASYGPGRCEVCNWPLAESRERGCVPGDCSYRPEDPAEQRRIADRRAALAASAPQEAPTFRAGDVVRHRPSGETWTVAYADPVRGDLAWCGWPDGAARIADCELIKAATDEQHLGTVRAVITGGGTRAAAAQRLYGNPDQDAQEAARG